MFCVLRRVCLGPDSPTSPIKELASHTRAMRMKHQALEDRLELCLLELRKLCVREAELTGKMSPDYPMSPDEKPPVIRRRIGTAFKLDEGLIQQDGEESVLQSLEAELALQRQICEAARRLSLEEHISKPVRKSRLQQCKRQERKMRELQETVFQHRIRHGCASPQTCHAKQREHSMSISDDSSLSDAAAMDDESDFSPSMMPCSGSGSSSRESPPPPLSPSRSSSSQCASSSLSLSVASSTSSLQEYQRSPIQNSPWRESSLDQPYHKNCGIGGTSLDQPYHKNSCGSISGISNNSSVGGSRKPASASSSRSSSPPGTPVQAGVDLRLADLPPPMQLANMKSLARLPAATSSAPSTPEMPARRQLSQSFRLPKNRPDFGKFGSEPATPQRSDPARGRPRVPRRHVGGDLPGVSVASPEYSPRRPCPSSSEDSSSEHSVPSYTSSPCRDAGARRPTAATTPTKAPVPPPYGYHLNSPHRANSTANAGPAAAETIGYKNNSNHQHHQIQHQQQPASNNEANVNRNNATLQRHLVANNSNEPIVEKVNHHHHPQALPVNNNNATPPSANNNVSPSGNTNNNTAGIYRNNQHHPSPTILRGGLAKESSPRDGEKDKPRVDPPPPPPKGVSTCPQNNNNGSSPSKQPATAPAPSPQKRAVVKPPPPPYARLVRTPSLKEYPTHATRLLMPREMVCEELKTWHQRNNSLRAPQPRPLDRQGSLRIKRPPTTTTATREPPAYKQPPQVVILQRAPDGTPLQWFEEEGAEIVSQV
ncbi:innate immunity activator protein isoform X2 [Engraulis encrasicolus]|uniref:innate immunity activator protein isoform X2 n=1 Tax=Engraulis encrasicolus TaxID=184585 RepID=UPI002FD2EE00